MNLYQNFKIPSVVMFAAVLSACTPEATFTVSPENNIKAGQTVTFNASESTVAKPERGNKVTNYQWTFGDGQSQNATTPTITHTYQQAGVYNATLTITDAVDQTNTYNKTITVLASDNAENPPEAVVPTTSNITVQSSSRNTLAGVKVTIDQTSVDTNEQGVASVALRELSPNEEIIIMAELDGFVAQSIRVQAKDAGNVIIRLRSVDQLVSIANIEQPKVIAINNTNIKDAKIQFAENTFVQADGSPAQGNASIQLSPWNLLTDTDAVPGNGQATNASGERITLVNNALFHIAAFDAEGKPLRIADGKTATVQVNLEKRRQGFAEPNLVEGDSIALWQFNTTTGLWEENGTAKIVSSESSKTGLAISADISQLASWSGAHKFMKTNSIYTTCTLSGTPVGCSVNGIATLPDGLKLPVNATLTQFGGNITVPADSQITWGAQGINNYAAAGSTTSNQRFGNFSFELTEPATTNLVRCFLPNGSGTACQVTATTSNGQTPFNLTVPVSGASIPTAFAGKALSWSASTHIAQTGNAAAERFMGETTSNGSQNVNISLTRDVLPNIEKTLRFTCAKRATTKAIGEEGFPAVGPNTPNVCRIIIKGGKSGQDLETTKANELPLFFDSGHISTDTEVVLNIPANTLQDDSMIQSFVFAKPINPSILPQYSLSPESRELFFRYYTFNDIPKTFGDTRNFRYLYDSYGNVESNRSTILSYSQRFLN